MENGLNNQIFQLTEYRSGYNDFYNSNLLTLGGSILGYIYFFCIQY